MSHDYHVTFCSGQMISGPPKKKKDVAKEVFEAAKKYVIITATNNYCTII